MICLCITKNTIKLIHQASTTMAGDGRSGKGSWGGGRLIGGGLGGDRYELGVSFQFRRSLKCYVTQWGVG